eukprot:356550-Chlamydomonas_euryale.AAC.5
MPCIEVQQGPQEDFPPSTGAPSPPREAPSSPGRALLHMLSSVFPDLQRNPSLYTAHICTAAPEAASLNSSLHGAARELFPRLHRFFWSPN